MTQWLWRFDTNLFLNLNFDGGHFLDSLFWFVSGNFSWTPLYLVVVYLLIRKLGWKFGLVAIAFIALAVIAADQVANFFKSNAPRLRPTHEPELQGLVHTVRDYVGGKYGTVSAHAATTFAIVTVSAKIIKSNLYTFLMIIWALVVSYSRIYLGVHYPMDIFFGIAAGVILGTIAVNLFRAVIFKLGYEPKQGGL